MESIGTLPLSTLPQAASIPARVRLGFGGIEVTFRKMLAPRAGLQIFRCTVDIRVQGGRFDEKPWSFCTRNRATTPLYRPSEHPGSIMDSAALSKAGDAKVDGFCRFLIL